MTLYVRDVDKLEELRAYEAGKKVSRLKDR